MTVGGISVVKNILYPINILKHRYHYYSNFEIRNVKTIMYERLFFIHDFYYKKKWEVINYAEKNILNEHLRQYWKKSRISRITVILNNILIWGTTRHSRKYYYTILRVETM